MVIVFLINNFYRIDDSFVDLKKNPQKLNHHDVDGGALFFNFVRMRRTASVGTSFVSRVLSCSSPGVERSLALEDE